MGVIMIGPPKSEKWPRHPTAVTPPRWGIGPASGVGAGPPVRGSCGPPIPFLPGFGCQVTATRFPPDMAAVVHAWDQSPGPCWCGGPARTP